MYRRFVSIAAVAAVLAFSPLAGSQDARPLTGEEIRALYSNNEMTATNNRGQQFTEQYKPDGTFSATSTRSDGTCCIADTGKWTIEGDKFLIAQANSKVDGSGRLVSETVSARSGGDFVTVTPDRVEYMDVSPKQVVSVDLPETPRRWLGGEAIRIRRDLGIPRDLARGEYDVLLNLPDPAGTLRNRPAFSIRLANAGTWEDSTGFNRLNHPVTIDPAAAGSAYKGDLVFSPR